MAGGMVASLEVVGGLGGSSGDNSGWLSRQQWVLGSLTSSLLF